MTERPTYADLGPGDGDECRQCHRANIVCCCHLGPIHDTALGHALKEAIERREQIDREWGA